METDFYVFPLKYQYSLLKTEFAKTFGPTGRPAKALMNENFLRECFGAPIKGFLEIELFRCVQAPQKIGFIRLFVYL